MKNKKTLDGKSKQILNKKEKLSKHNIEDLMGIWRDTYERRNGKIRRK